MKRLVAREKRDSFRSFCDELQNIRLALSQAVVKRIAQTKQRYVIHHQPQGKTLNLCEYPLSQNEDSRAPRTMPWSGGTFFPAVHLQDQIEKAIISIPNKKAAGPDFVLAEAMKTAPKRQAEFLWRPVGRTGIIPTQWTKCTVVPPPPNRSSLPLEEVIEKFLDKAVRADYEFHSAQLRFLRHQGTEIAFLPAIPPPTLQDD